jgi:hypothetical protein
MKEVVGDDSLASLSLVTSGAQVDRELGMRRRGHLEANAVAGEETMSGVPHHDLDLIDDSGLHRQGFAVTGAIAKPD